MEDVTVIDHVVDTVVFSESLTVRVIVPEFACGLGQLISPVALLMVIPDGALLKL